MSPVDSWAESVKSDTSCREQVSFQTRPGSVEAGCTLDPTPGHLCSSDLGSYVMGMP